MRMSNILQFPHVQAVLATNYRTYWYIPPYLEASWSQDRIMPFRPIIRWHLRIMASEVIRALGLMTNS